MFPYPVTQAYRSIRTDCYPFPLMHMELSNRLFRCCRENLRFVSRRRTFKDLFDAVSEIKDWCDGVALFPHEKFFSSLQFFGKSYRTTILLLLFIYKNVYARFFAHRSVITYLLSLIVLFRAFLFAGVLCVPSVVLALEACP